MSSFSRENQHSFAQVPQVNLERSKFDRSHGVKTTFNAGYLVPIYVDHALPGDTFTLDTAVMARLATPLRATMDNIYLDTFFFAVPKRLVWTNFVKQMGEQVNPGDSIDFLTPIMTSTPAYTNSSIFDYFGLPVGKVGYSHSALEFRAYNLIWNTWFRDQNLQNSVTVNMGDGPDPVTDYTLLKRGKRHDYFTSCLPWPQKGTAVSLPLGSTAPLVVPSGATSPAVLRTTAAGHPLHGSATVVTSSGVLQAGAGSNAILDPQGSLVVDLSTASAATINSIREAFQLQRMLERDARGGTRYIELIKSHFSVVSPDARLQRPEYLGGGEVRVNIHPVPSTAESGTKPQGHMAGYGVAAGRMNGFSKSFTEHTIIIGLASVRADLNYQQGLDRMWSKRTRYDEYWPSLSHLGEQPVYNREIYCNADANDSNVFGYQERYAEYRFKPSRICGQFRSSYATPLDSWHLAQNFASLPTLGNTFIQETPPIERIIAVPTEAHFLADFWFKLHCARPMPVYGVPGMLDHF